MGLSPHTGGMDTTTIEVKVETWSALNQQKRPGDSFDDVIQRLLAEGGPERAPEPTPDAPTRDDHVALGDDLPASVDAADARDVVGVVLEAIDAHGPLERSAIVAELDDRHSLGYDMSNRDGAWWKRIVAPGVKANGCEHKPGRGWTR